MTSKPTRQQPQGPQALGPASFLCRLAKEACERHTAKGTLPAEQQVIQLIQECQSARLMLQSPLLVRRFAFELVDLAN